MGRFNPNQLTGTMTRRGFLRVSTSIAAALGTELSAAKLFGAPGSSSSSRRHLPVIILFNSGGPSQKETFSPDAPGTPSELRGSCSSIATRLTGIKYCEHWPMLAQRNDRYALLRGLDSMSGDHFTSARTMLRPGNADTFGIEWGERAANGGVPYVFVEVPSTFSPMDALQTNRSMHIRWRRDESAPNVSGSDWERALVGPGRFAAPEMRADPGIRDRIALLQAFDRSSSLSGPAVERRDRCYQLAIDLMLGGGSFFEAFTPPKSEAAAYERDLERYGGPDSRIGQGLLLARRLAERGAGVCILYNEKGLGWDMHSQLFDRIRPLAAETDRAASALLDDIRSGRFEGIFVMVGEFGRTPTVNASAGRDHWGTGFPGIFAGGKFRAGVVHGETTPRGEIRSGRVPTDQLVSTITIAAGGEVAPTAARAREILDS